MEKRTVLCVYDDFDQREYCAKDSAEESATHAREVQAWLRLLHAQLERPGAQDNFYKLLRGNSGKQSDKTIVIINQARQWIGRVYPFGHSSGAKGPVDSPSKARYCQYLYNRVLYKLMSRAISGAGGGQEVSPKMQECLVQNVLEDDDMLSGLLICCLELVNFAFLDDPQQAFPSITSSVGQLSQCLEIWNAIDWMTSMLGHGDMPIGIPAMPQCLLDYLAAMQTRILEELAFLDGSSIYARIITLGCCSDDPENDSIAAKKRRSSIKNGPDAVLMARFVQSLVTLALDRTAAVCNGLLEQHTELQKVPDLPSKCCTVVDMALYDHLHLLFNQHMSVVIASAVYFTLRLCGIALSFRKITSFMVGALPNHCDEIFSQVEVPPEGDLGSANNEDQIVLGDTRQFYNRVFLPTMEGYTTNALFEDSASGTSAGGNHCLGAAQGGAHRDEVAAGQTPREAGQKLLGALPLGARLCRRGELEAPLGGVSSRGQERSEEGKKGCSGGRGKRGLASKSGGAGRLRKPLLRVDGNHEGGVM